MNDINLLIHWINQLFMAWMMALIGKCMARWNYRRCCFEIREVGHPKHHSNWISRKNSDAVSPTSDSLQTFKQCLHHVIFSKWICPTVSRTVHISLGRFANMLHIRNSRNHESRDFEVLGKIERLYYNMDLEHRLDLSGGTLTFQALQIV